MDVNAAACKFYGWDKPTFVKMNLSQINTLSPEEIIEGMKQAAAKPNSHLFFRHKKASGEMADVEVFTGPITIKGQVLMYSIIHDISSRVASEKALKESEARFRQLVDSAPDAIFIQQNNKFVYVNAAAVELFGAQSPEQLLGTPIKDRIHPDYLSIVKQRLQVLHEKKSVPPCQEIYLKLDGTPVDVDVTAVCIDYNNAPGTLIITRDISERVRLEKLKLGFESQLRQQQKLEAIGTLAGGVAHEINNPINGIMNYAELIRDGVDKDSKEALFAGEIIHETERISLIVKNLLQFSRHEKQAHSYASIYDIINQTISLINTIIKKDQIKFNVQIEENLPDIKCRSQQIQQVLMNLLTNARDALNEKYPGYDEDKIINLTCSKFDADGRRWLRLIVEDHGNGIPEKIMDKIFEPFFSTKPKEKGTGLGLSISFGIVKDHHGNIFVESEKGRCTRFILELPVDNGWELQGSLQE